LFTAEARAPYVAITGSNGKSTVTTLLSLMCNAAGKRSLAGANLGVPALDLLAEPEPDFYILELSSFQLQRTDNLPAAVAVLLNISPDHLDWHRSEEEYRLAKYRIFSEARAAVWNRADEAVASYLPAATKGLSFGLDEPADGQYGLRVEDGALFLARGKELLLSTADIAMVGTHNFANALAALAAGELMGLALPPMLQVVNQFPGLPHRMQRVARHNRRTFINDSKATNVGAAIASVESIDGKVVLIAGGQGKGGDFNKLATATYPHLRSVVLIGEDAGKIADAFEGLVPVQHERNLFDAVKRAATLARPGDTVLLAPACASLDQYPNYQVRGDDFCRAVRSITT
jgi:UDP-N-acetylmuramoylalanine--D-glutamate ligase